jgi:hypothetical protein
VLEALMPGWLIVLIALVVLLPLAAWLGRSQGRKARGGLGLAMLMLGLGEAVDPPSRHVVETDAARNKARPAPGDPPVD